MRRLLAILALGLAVAAPPAQARTGAEFRQWAAVCDNTLTCVATGGSSYHATGFYLQVRREGTPLAPVTIVLGGQPYFSDGPTPPAISMQIERADGSVLFRRRLVLAADQGSIYRWPLAATDDLLAAIRDGARIRLVGDGIDPSTVEELDGSAAALRWIDEQQHRAGTVTALVARGPAPATQVPPPNGPLIRRAPTASQQRLPKRPPAFITKAMVASCEADGRSWSVSRLAAGRLLWLVSCSNVRGYNTGFLAFMTDEAGQGLPLPPIDPGFPGGDDDEADVSPTQGGYNLAYNPATRTLSAAFYGRRMRDSGWRVEWIWEGAGFRRSRLAFSSEEHASYDWPTAWRADVR